MRPLSALLHACKGSQAPADQVRMQRASQSHQPTFSAPKHSGRIPPLGMPNAGQGRRACAAASCPARHRACRILFANASRVSVLVNNVSVRNDDAGGAFFVVVLFGPADSVESRTFSDCSAEGPTHSRRPWATAQSSGLQSSLLPLARMTLRSPSSSMAREPDGNASSQLIHAPLKTEPEQDKRRDRRPLCQAQFRPLILASHSTTHQPSPDKSHQTRETRDPPTAEAD